VATATAAEDRLGVSGDGAVVLDVVLGASAVLATVLAARWQDSVLSERRHRRHRHLLVTGAGVAGLGMTGIPHGWLTGIGGDQLLTSARWTLVLYVWILATATLVVRASVRRNRVPGQLRKLSIGQQPSPKWWAGAP
jgi:hypothetical protein